MSYCKNCGKEISGNQKFCPDCGSEISFKMNNENPDNVSNEKLGKMIISTKGKMETFVLVCCILSIVLAIAALLSLGILHEVLSHEFGEIGGIIAIIVVVFLAISFIIDPVIKILQYKSYCDVHENGVSCCTMVSFNHLNDPIQKIDLKYKDIMNVTENGRCLTIYTTYKEFEVLAVNNRKEALEIIRNKICK